MFKRKLLLTSLLGSSIAMLSFADSALGVEEILTKANAANAESSYKAMISIGANQDDKTVFYQKVNQDGTVWTRSEKLKPSKVLVIFIKNDAGYFEIIGNTVIKRMDMDLPVKGTSIKVIKKGDNAFVVGGKEVTREMVGEENFARLELMSKGVKSPHCNAECTEIDYNGIPCYLIKVKSEVTAEMITQYKNEMPAEEKKLLKNVDYAQQVPALTEYVIGRKNFFIYSSRKFNNVGRLLLRISYSDVIFNPPLSDSLFVLPKSTGIKGL